MSNLQDDGFQTSRLNVVPIAKFEQHCEQDTLLTDIIAILTPAVVEELPAYFQNITSAKHAQYWLSEMKRESRLYVVTSVDTNKMLGFLFLYETQNDVMHLGYVMSEECWGNGFATELLKELVAYCRQHNVVSELVGGVSDKNTASIKVLNKAGFIKSAPNDEGVCFYHYLFNQRQ